jgi:tetratricopeptide (TPR) repeat protein
MEAAFCLDAIAQCHQQREAFDEAEKLRREAVIIGEELLGAEHPDVHGFRERLDKLRQDRNLSNIGQDEASKTLLDRLSDEYNAAVAAGQDTTLPEQPSDNYSAFMVEKYIANGKTAMAQKNVREAESQFRLAVDKAEAVDNRDARKLEAIRLLAGILEPQGRDQEAKQLYEKALTLAFRYIGWQDVQVGHALCSLADLHRRLGELGLTKNYYKQSIATYSMTLGPEHETTIATQAKNNDFLDSIKEDTKWKGWSA